MCVCVCVFGRNFFLKETGTSHDAVSVCVCAYALQKGRKWCAWYDDFTFSVSVCALCAPYMQNHMRVCVCVFARAHMGWGVVCGNWLWKSHVPVTSMYFTQTRCGKSFVHGVISHFESGYGKNL